MNPVAFIRPHHLYPYLVSRVRHVRNYRAREDDGMSPDGFIGSHNLDPCLVSRGHLGSSSRVGQVHPKARPSRLWYWWATLLPVIFLTLIYSSGAPICKLIGPSGLVCMVTERGCLLPRWVCGDLSTSTRSLGSRDGLAAVVAVNTRARAITDFIAGSNDVMKTYGFDKLKGYADFYLNMERTRKQNAKVRSKGEDLLDKIPETASFVERELKSLRVRASAMQRHFSEEPELIIHFLRSLNVSLDKIILAVDDESRMWEELYGEIKLLLGYGNNLLSRLNTQLGFGEAGRVLRRAEVLAPLTVTKSDRVAGSVLSTGTAMVATYAVCAFFPPAWAVAGPVASALTLSFTAMAHKRAQATDAQYYRMELANTQLESIMSTMHVALPGYLQSVEDSSKRVKAVARQLAALRDTLGDAEGERLKMIENEQATRTAIAQFLGFIDTGINDMEGVRDLALSGRELLVQHAIDSGSRTWSNVVANRGARRT